jgi:hypothetical protein
MTHVFLRTSRKYSVHSIFCLFFFNYLERTSAASFTNSIKSLTGGTGSFDATVDAGAPGAVGVLVRSPFALERACFLCLRAATCHPFTLRVKLMAPVCTFWSFHLFFFVRILRIHPWYLWPFGLWDLSIFHAAIFFRLYAHAY